MFEFLIEIARFLRDCSAPITGVHVWCEGPHIVVEGPGMHDMFATFSAYMLPQGLPFPR